MEWGRRAYGRLFLELANPIYGWFGVTAYQGGVRERYINYIPFLVLMILTPRISWRHRTLGTLAGLVLIFFFQLGFNLWVESAYPVQGGQRGGGFEVYLPGHPAGRRAAADPVGRDLPRFRGRRDLPGLRHLGHQPFGLNPWEPVRDTPVVDGRFRPWALRRRWRWRWAAQS